jgi:hypothetical protein
MWHEKEPSLLKTMSAKHRSKFAVLSPVMVTGNGDSRRIAEKIAQAAINKTNKQTNKRTNLLRTNTCLNIKQVISERPMALYY